MQTTKDKLASLDGIEITLEDLPPPDTVRWITRRKATVVAAVQGGLITQKQACNRYGLSDEEFNSWVSLYYKYGEKGLRTTRSQVYR